MNHHNIHNMNHLMTLADKAADMSPDAKGAESRLLAVIAAQQRRIEALEAITFGMSNVYYNWLFGGQEGQLKFNQWLGFTPGDLGVYFRHAYQYHQELEEE